MLITRRYRNNLGYQIDVDRPHPMQIFEMDRYNRNYYNYDDQTVTMHYNKGGLKGLQYGGKYEEKKQYGEGIDPKTVVKALQLLKTGAKVALKAYASPIGNLIKNKYGNFMNTNPNWRPGFAGERHLMTKKGITYNWCGPGTAVTERLQRGDLGLNELDEICKVHDIDYMGAQTWSDVRKADKKMIKSLDESSVDKISKTFIKSLMKAKVLGEKTGVFGKEQFTSLPHVQDELPTKIEEKQPGIDLAGHGIKKNRDPAYKLKRKIKKYRRKQKTDKILGIAFQSIKKRLK